MRIMWPFLFLDQKLKTEDSLSKKSVTLDQTKESEENNEKDENDGELKMAKTGGNPNEAEIDLRIFKK